MFIPNANLPFGLSPAVQKQVRVRCVVVEPQHGGLISSRAPAANARSRAERAVGTFAWFQHAFPTIYDSRLPQAGVSDVAEALTKTYNGLDYLLSLFATAPSPRRCRGECRFKFREEQTSTLSRRVVGKAAQAQIADLGLERACLCLLLFTDRAHSCCMVGSLRIDVGRSTLWAFTTMRTQGLKAWLNRAAPAAK